MTASSAESGRQSDGKKIESKDKSKKGRVGGVVWGGEAREGREKKQVCHRAIPPLDMLPQKQMYGVNTAWITAPGRRITAV